MRSRFKNLEKQPPSWKPTAILKTYLLSVPFSHRLLLLATLLPKKFGKNNDKLIYSYITRNKKNGQDLDIAKTRKQGSIL